MTKSKNYNLNRTTFTPAQRSFLLQIAPEIDVINDVKKLMVAKKRLHLLMRASSKPHKGYVNGVLYLINSRLKEIDPAAVAYKEEEKNTHRKVSDHAMVQYLRRAHGLDIEAIKDKILEQNNEHNILEPVYCMKGKIVTFL